MGERSSEIARTELFTNVHRVLRLLRAFEVSNSVFDAPIEELARATRSIVELEGEIEMRLEENTVFVNRWPLRLDRGGRERAVELQTELASYGIGAIVLKAALTNDSIRAFLRVLAASHQEKAPAAAFEKIRPGLGDSGVADALSVLSVAHVKETSLIGQVEASGGALAKRATSRAFGILRVLYDRYDDAALRKLLLARLRRSIQAFVGLLEKEPDRGLALTMVSGLGDALIEHALGTAIIAVALGRAQGMPRSRVADLGVSAALHCLGHRGFGGERRTLGDRRSDLQSADLAVTPYRALADILAERSLDSSLATALVVSYEHTIPDGYPEANEDLPPLLASRVIGVAHTYHGRAQRSGPKDALERTLEMFTLDPRVLVELAQLLGPVPPGSLVVLHGGTEALVVRANAEKPDRPRVRVLDGNVSTVLDLSGDGMPAVATVIDAPGSIARIAPYLFT